jgi:glutathione synthase/RimK-type ligase-like ATP-grasp enzyme
VPLENAPALQLWNSDRRYLADLAAAGIPTVPTRFVAPGAAAPELAGEVVIKPSVSAGGRHTGRVGPRAHAAARALLAEIAASGRTAMVQPYVAGVERAGETAVVVIDGAVSHVLRKGAILAPDEVAPARADALAAAERMYDPALVRASTARPDELALAERVLAFVEQRFGTRPLFVRVDLLRAADGTPVLLELEAIEPSLYTDEAPGSAARLADAILVRARAARLRPTGTHAT